MTTHSHSERHFYTLSTDLPLTLCLPYPLVWDPRVVVVIKGRELLGTQLAIGIYRPPTAPTHTFVVEMCPPHVWCLTRLSFRDDGGCSVNTNVNQ